MVVIFRLVTQLTSTPGTAVRPELSALLSVTSLTTHKLVRCRVRRSHGVS
jgi:hypothetical protein